jgi:hypothetical protein
MAIIIFMLLLPPPPLLLPLPFTNNRIWIQLSKNLAFESTPSFY